MKKRMRIALVEDNRFHAILFEQSVREKLPESIIQVFETGHSFIDTMGKNEYDLICLDYHLPDTNGLDMLELIRIEKNDVPIVIITGAGNEQIAVEAMKSGATDYVTKDGDYCLTVPRVIKQAYHKQRLIIKNRKLEDKAKSTEQLETITTMTSTLNHEINNPLMAILGNIELLLENPDEYKPEMRKKLEMISHSAQRIESITRQMANLTSTATTETPVGPMLKLKRSKGKKPKVKLPQNTETADKTN